MAFPEAGSLNVDVGKRPPPFQSFHHFAEHERPPPPSVRCQSSMINSAVPTTCIPVVLILTNTLLVSRVKTGTRCIHYLMLHLTQSKKMEGWEMQIIKKIS